MLLGCCCPACVVFSDDFARESLGENWVVESGTAVITDDQLVLSGTDALVRAVAEADTQAMRVTTHAKGPAGAKLRAIVAMLDDDNYLYGELEIDGDTAGSLSLWKVEDGTAEQLGDSVSVNASADTLHRIVVCFTPGEGGYDPTPGRLRVDALAQNVIHNTDGFGNRAGLGAPDSGTFDDFTLENGNSDVHPNCPSCDPARGPCPTRCIDGESWSEYLIDFPESSFPFPEPNCDCDGAFQEGTYPVSQVSPCEWRTEWIPFACTVEGWAWWRFRFAVLDGSFLVQIFLANQGQFTFTLLATWSKSFGSPDPIDCIHFGSATLINIGDDSAFLCGDDAQMPEEITIRTPL